MHADVCEEVKSLGHEAEVFDALLAQAGVYCDNKPR